MEKIEINQNTDTTKTNVSRYSPREEKYNTISHAVGIIFGLLAGIVLLTVAIPTGNGWLIGSYTVFAVFMTMMFTTSTLYHAEKKETRKFILRKFDHAAIYCLIAGSYTPFTLVLLRNEGYWGWLLFAVVWTAAIAGVIFSFTNLQNAGKLETICYLAMSWVVIFAFKPLIHVLTAANSMQIFYWLIGGGVFYTLGTILYRMKKINYTHAVWHLFVLGGCICHAYAIWLIARIA